MTGATVAMHGGRFGCGCRPIKPVLSRFSCHSFHRPQIDRFVDLSDPCLPTATLNLLILGYL